MKKLLLFTLLCCFPFTFLLAQQGLDEQKEKYLKKREGIIYPNVVKVNSMALLFRNLSLSYERGVSPRFSAGIGVGYMYGGREPGFFNVDNEKIDLDYHPINGFIITPEVRWYARKCDNNILEGFYLGLYLRFSRYYTSLDFDYFPEEHQPLNYGADVELGEYGIGLQLGYQLVLWKRLNIDFMFFGPRYSSYHIGYEFDKIISPEFLYDLSGYLTDVLNRFGVDYTVDLKQSGDARASHSFSFANVRFAVGIGFAF